MEDENVTVYDENDETEFLFPLDEEIGESASLPHRNNVLNTSGSFSAIEPCDGEFDSSVVADSYTIVREIGGGAMSRTFEVRSNKLGNSWFLKFVSNKDGQLMNEEEILKHLNHPGLPKIVDVFYRNEGTYLIETLVEGAPLNMVGGIKMKFTEDVLFDWFEQMAQVLNYIHSMRPQPVYHLDMKPGNIMITHDNRLVLVDFGISRRFGEDRSATMTVTYAAPEQFGGRVPEKYKYLFDERFGELPSDWASWSIDARTDIYSLGVILFELATGQTPTQKNKQLLYKRVSRKLSRIIQRCMEMEPSKRFHSAAELLDALRPEKGIKIRNLSTLLLQRQVKFAAIAIPILLAVFVLLVWQFGSDEPDVSDDGLNTAYENGQELIRVQQEYAYLLEQEERRQAEIEAEVARRLEERETEPEQEPEQVEYAQDAGQELYEGPPLEPIEALFEAIFNTTDWVRLTMNWTGNRQTIFERDRDSRLWTMVSREGTFRMVDPIFSAHGNVFNIGFPTTTNIYHLYNDGTGRFDQSLTWVLETNPDFTINSYWGANQTANLHNALSQHQLVTIRVFWSNGQFAYFYGNFNEGWMMRGRQGGLSGVSLSFSSFPNGVVMTRGSEIFTLNDGGSGSFGYEGISWSFCFID